MQKWKKEATYKCLPSRYGGIAANAKLTKRENTKTRQSEREEAIIAILKIAIAEDLQVRDAPGNAERPDIYNVKRYLK